MESSKTCETFSCAHLVVLRWLYAMCVLAFSLSSDVQSLKEFKPLPVPAVWKNHKHESTCNTLTIQNNHPAIIIISLNICLTALHVIFLYVFSHI